MTLLASGGLKTAWESFEAGRLEPGAMPARASIEVSRNCNFRCVMCPQSWRPEYAERRPEFDMSPALFARVAGQLFPGLETAHLQGFGESTASPHWPAILELCAPWSGRLRLSLLTNLGRPDAASWRRTVELGFDLQFSCDGADQATFESIRRGSRFASILKNLETVRSSRRVIPGAGELAFVVTLQRLNYRQMPSFVDFAARSGADRVLFAAVRDGLPLAPREAAASLRRLPARELAATARRWLRRRLAAGAQPRGLGLESLPRAELAALKAETLERAAARGLPVAFNDAFLDALPPRAHRPSPRPGDWRAAVEDSARVSVHKRCFKPYSYMVVNYRGEAGLCNHLITDSSWERMGSLETSTLAEIWNSPSYLEARRRHLAGRPENPACRWCLEHRVSE